MPTDNVPSSLDANESTAVQNDTNPGNIASATSGDLKVQSAVYKTTYENFRALFYFDINGTIGAGATITAATLYLYMTLANQTVSATHVGERLTSSFTETNGNAAPSRDTGTQHTSWGVSQNATGVYSQSITTLVQNWYSGTWTNYGIRIRQSPENHSTSALAAYNYGAREHGTSAYRPYVAVTYTTQSPPTTPGAFTTPASDGTSVAVSASMSLAWGASTDPNSDTITYSLEVSRDSEGYVVCNTGTSNSITLDTSDWAAGSYQFRVRAIDVSGSNTYSSYNTARQVNITRSFTDTSEQIDQGAPDNATGVSTGLSNERKIAYLQDGTPLVLFEGTTSTPEAAGYLRRKHSGSWQVLTNGTVLGFDRGSVSTYVDGTGVQRIVVAWRQNGTAGSRVSGGNYIMCGSLNLGTDTITWGTAVRFGAHTVADMPDMVAHAEGTSTGGMAHVVMGYLESGPINITFYYPCSISGNTITVGTGQSLSPPYEVAGYGYDSHSYPSIDFDPLTKRLGVIWSSGIYGSGTAYNYVGTRFSYAEPSSLVFFYTGSEQTWVVPAGVTEIDVDMMGASGGDAYPWTDAPTRGGKGGRVRCKLAVTPGETLRLYVGGRGNNGQNWLTGNSGSSLGGWNGGGDGGKTGEATGEGAGGGGATDIRRGGTALANRILVAGGGGGASPTIPGGGIGKGGGIGGGTTGGAGEGNSSMGGSGGTQAAGGAAGTNSNATAGTAGSLGNGGNGGAYDFYNNGDGGGGGGGYYGGGGGSTNNSGAIAFYNGGGGGGGGSSYVTGATQVINEQGVGSPDGYGQIRISYAGASTRVWSFVTHRTVDQNLALTGTSTGNINGNILRWDGVGWVAAVSVAGADGYKVYESLDFFATTPTTLLTNTTNTAHDIQLAVSSFNRDIYVVYSHHSGEFFSEIRYRRYNRNTSTWDSPVTIYTGKTPSYTNAFDVNIAYYRGKLRVLFGTGQSTPYQIRTLEVTISGRTDVVPKADILSTGWRTHNAGTTNLYAAIDESTLDDSDFITSALFRETFDGTDGSAWNATRWSNAYDSGAGATATIQGNAGQLSVGGANYTRMVQLATGTYGNTTIRFSITPGAGSVEQYVGINFKGDANHSGAGNHENTDNGYFLGWESSQYLVLRKTVNGTATDVGTTVDIGNAASTTKRWFRITTTSSSHSVYTWLDGSAEATSPSISGTDSTYSSGRISFYAMSGSNTTTRTFTIDDIVITSL